MQRTMATSDMGSTLQEIDDVDEPEKITIISYSRAPGALREALLYSKELAPARSALTEAGYDFILKPSEAKVFVHPSDYRVAMVEITFRAYVLKDIILRPSSVIVSESYRAALDKCISDAVRNNAREPRATRNRINLRVKKTFELYPNPEYG